MIEINAVKHPGLHRYARELRQYPELTKEQYHAVISDLKQPEKNDVYQTAREKLICSHLGMVLTMAVNTIHRYYVEHFFIFQKNSLHLKMANFSSLKRRSIFTSRKILREKLELHSASKKSLNIAKMVEKRFELPTSTHDLSYEKIRLADCHKIPIFSDKSENPHARVTGVHKFLTFTPPSVPVDNREASHQEMKSL